MFGLGPRIPLPPDPRRRRAPRDTYGSLPIEEQFLVVFDDVRDFGDECNYYADVLGWLATRRGRLRRNLNFTAGLITLISSGAVWAVVADILTSTYLRYGAAFCTFAGGLCTLITTHFLEDDQAARLLRGAEAFRALGLDAKIDLSEPAFIELTRIAGDRQLSREGPDSKRDLSEEQRKEFRTAGERAYNRLKELKEQRRGVVELEQFVKDAQARYGVQPGKARSQTGADPWA
jgi:hypothetical protein